MGRGVETTVPPFVGLSDAAPGGEDQEGYPVRYLMLVCVDQETAVEVDPTAWLDEMEGRGIRQSGNRLQPVRDSTTVRVRDGEVLIADGPFAETKEQIVGFDVLECADLDEAIEVAAKHPVATFGALELRPSWTP
jgi:hypothetical protein